MDDAIPGFNDLLRNARREAGLTQEELAARAGVSERTISNLERGINRAPQRETFVLLAEALELEPAVRRQWERVRSRHATRAPANRRIPATSSPVSGSELPARITSLLGRERDVQYVISLLERTGVRLVTVTGPGGIGKTSLAVVAAETLRDSFAGGVYFVSLTALDSADLVVQAVMKGFGIEGGSDPVQTISSSLQDRSVLLVLDNFEHVVPAAPFVSAVLQACPGLTVLATSRVPLRLSGEHEFPLQPLANDASVALFIERSTAVRPDFNPGDVDYAAIEQICARLDGLPLAIELAAARSRILTPPALLERLDRPLSLLTGGSRDLPDRQQTLRSTIAWSYNLLSPEAQAAFRALSMFADNWSLEAANAVVPGDVDVLESVMTLVEGSLVQQQPEDNVPTFRMLATIREYGREQLMLADELDDAAYRHARYFLDMAERFIPDFRGAASGKRHQELAAKHDDLRAALACMLDRDPERALYVVSHLEKYWFTRGVFDEWKYWLNEALSRSREPASPGRARALHQVAFIALQQHDHDLARVTATESLELAKHLDMPESMGRAITTLSYLEERDGNLERAIELAEEALAQYRKSGFEIAIATQLQIIASFASRTEDYERELAMREEALHLQRATGDSFFTSIGLVETGVTLRNLSRTREAAELIDEGLAMARTIAAPRVQALALLARGLVAVDDERYDLARSTLLEALHTSRTANIPLNQPAMLEGVAALLTAARHIDLAVQLFSAADVARNATNQPQHAASRSMCRHHLDYCRSQLDSDAFTTAWNTGRTLSLDTAIDVALELLEP